MSILTSQFDIVSVDNPVSLAALAEVLDADLGSETASTLYSTNGTPLTPAAIALPPGTVVRMNATGKAIKATLPVMTVAANQVPVPFLPFITIDGNTDYSGAFSRKITCLHGGFKMVTDQLDKSNGGSFTPGSPVSANAGKIVPRAAGDLQRQIYGFVAKEGEDTVAGTVTIIVPQGICAF